MSQPQARRMTEALEAARANTRVAVSAAGLYRHRGTREPLPLHITGLADLVVAMETIHAISVDMAEVVKHCAENVRARYVNGHIPSASDWPQELKAVAADADQALYKLRQYLSKAAPFIPSHTALQMLQEAVRDVHRSQRGDA